MELEDLTRALGRQHQFAYEDFKMHPSPLLQFTYGKNDLPHKLKENNPCPENVETQKHSIN
jgi:hypothetical protein